jgi:DNA-binding CsgD family transcriptional regulator
MLSILEEFGVAEADLLEILSPQEKSAYMLFADGSTRNDISAGLEVSYNRAKNLLQAVRRKAKKLGAVQTSQLQPRRLSSCVGV